MVVGGLVMEEYYCCCCCRFSYLCFVVVKIVHLLNSEELNEVMCCVGLS